MSVASAISDGVDSDDRNWGAGCDGDVEQVSEGLVPSGFQFLLGLAAVFAEKCGGCGLFMHDSGN
jgi:hypothetical protein